MKKEADIAMWGRWKIVWVDSSDINTALELSRAGVVDGLGLSPYSGYTSNDISFLRDAPYIRGVVLPYAEKYDLSVLSSLEPLRFLTVAGNRQAIDYGAFHELEDLRIEWQATAQLPPPEYPLKSLYLRGYKPKSRDLRDLPHYESLEEIEFVQGNLTELSGIDSLGALISASFFHLRQLQSVAALADTHIEYLHIEGSKKIKDLPSLMACGKLKSFRFASGGIIPSLRMLDDFPALEEFRFVNTTIADGDMTPLLRLKSVGFLKKKGYSHTPDEVERAISHS